MKKYSIALGSFDGVHIGHRKVLQKACEQKDCTSVAVYFALPPAMAFDDPELITTDCERKELFRQLGIETVETLDFCKVKDMSANGFFNYLKDKYSPCLISCGFNYRFGKGASGDTALLQKLCDENKIELSVCEPVTLSGQTVSSSVIREKIKSGDMESVCKMLGNPYSFCGTCNHGEKRGTGMGFPTVNIDFPIQKVSPKPGVYISKLTVDKNTFGAVTNLGSRPTYPCDNPPTETYIINGDVELYGKCVKIELVKFIRPSLKFADQKALSDAIHNDVCLAKEFFNIQE